jgi:PAS domain S-box-containing protein
MDDQKDNEKTREQLIREVQALRYFAESSKVIAEEKVRLKDALDGCNATLEALIFSGPEAVLLADVDGTIVIANEAAAVRFGRNREELAGACLHDLLPGGAGERSRKHVNEVIFTGRPVLFSEALEGRYYDNSYAPVFDRQGLVTRIVIFSLDRTDREAAVTALKTLKRRYRITCETVEEGIWQAMPDGRLTGVNSAFTRILGYSSPEVFLGSLQGSALDLFADPACREEFSRLLTRSNYLQSFEAQAIRKDHSLVWLSITARAVRDTKKQLLYYEGAIEDVTRRKRIETQLRQSQKTEAVGRLAGGIAHDFNNLVTVIVGNLDLLLSRFSPGDDAYQEIRNLQRTAGNALKLCTQFLDLSRRQLVNMSEIDLNEVILRMGTMFRRLIGEDIRQDLALDPEIGIIRADPSLIEQIILNLVVNARDAMPGGGTLRVSTEMEQFGGPVYGDTVTGRHVVLAVADTGTGILPAILEHIFEPFNTIKPDGTGLGLSIVHSIVKQFGGHISVESKPGKGTTFRIYFPVATNEAKAEKTGEVQPVDLIPSGKAAVLVVEDDPSVLNLIVDFLESLEYTVYAASSVDEAISVIEEPGRRVDLLISDVVLPGKKGTELAAMLKERHPEIKIMLMSGYADEKIPHTEILKSKIHFLAKPFSPLMLVMKVQEILEDSRTIL